MCLIEVLESEGALVLLGEDLQQARAFGVELDELADRVVHVHDGCEGWREEWGGEGVVR